MRFFIQKSVNSFSFGLSIVMLFVHLPLFASEDSKENRSFIVAAYLQGHSQYFQGEEGRSSFTLQAIDPDILTDLYFAFVGFGYISKAVDPTNPRLTGDYTLQTYDPQDEDKLFKDLAELKVKSKKGLRIILSIGGGNFNNPDDPQGIGQHTHHLFSHMIASQESRKQFIDAAIAYAKRYSFDGIDIDWESPGDALRGGAPEDFRNFIDLLKEASLEFSKLSPPLILSIAVHPTVPYGAPKEYHDRPEMYYRWIADCSRYVDRISLMAYDYSGPFVRPMVTGHNAPLYGAALGGAGSITRSLKNLVDNGVVPEKLLLGIPTFGHSFEGVQDLTSTDNKAGKVFTKPGEAGRITRVPGLLSYFEIMDRVGRGELTAAFDNATGTAYAFNDQKGVWISFDTPVSVKMKAEAALREKLGGVIFWSADMDEYFKKPTFPNIRAAWKVFYPTQE